MITLQRKIGEEEQGATFEDCKTAATGVAMINEAGGDENPQWEIFTFDECIERGMTPLQILELGIYTEPLTQEQGDTFGEELKARIMAGIDIDKLIN
jgi:hypothetical protein